MIANPNAPAVVAKPAMGSGERARLGTDLEGLIRGWPARDGLGQPIAFIAVHELVGALRRAGAAPEVGAEEVRAALRGLGYEV